MKMNSGKERNDSASGDGSLKKKAIALAEVIIVRFVVYALIARILLLTLFGSLDTNKPFAPYVVGALWFVIPCTIIIAAKRSLGAYGLKSKNLRKDIELGLNAFLVLLITFVGYASLSVLGWSYIEPNGALLLTGAFLLALVLMIFMLERTDKENEAKSGKFYGNILFIIVLLMLPLLGGALMEKLTFLLISTVIWQFIFSGFGEEVFFRGYIQSRLNDAFGRPYEIKGIAFGPGLFITALLFSITHVLNPFDIYTLTGELAIWWGTFTFVGGLIFGLIREYSDSVIPGGIAHGLDAFGEAMGVLFS